MVLFPFCENCDFPCYAGCSTIATREQLGPFSREEVLFQLAWTWEVRAPFPAVCVFRVLITCWWRSLLQVMADDLGDYKLADRAADMYKQVFCMIKPEASVYEPPLAATNPPPPPEVLEDLAVDTSPAGAEPGSPTAASPTSAVGSPASPSKKKKPKKKKAEASITVPTWPMEPNLHSWQEFDHTTLALFSPRLQRAFNGALARWRSSPLTWMRIARSYRQRNCNLLAVGCCVTKW